MSHMEEGGLKNFTNSVIFLVKLFAGLKDKFLAQKLYDKISEFVAGYIKLFNSKGGGVESESTSHNMRLRDLLNSLDGLLELLDYLEHSKLVSATPLLYYLYVYRERLSFPKFGVHVSSTELSDQVEMIFMMPSESYAYLSARLIKEAGALGADLSAFVPSFVAKALHRKLG